MRRLRVTCSIVQVLPWLTLTATIAEASGAPAVRTSSAATGTSTSSLTGGSPLGDGTRLASRDFAAGDGVLAALVRESLERRPELARAEALIRAGRERAVRARALPDPMISVGIQNDGFTSIEIGEMETSFVSIMATQSFPWPGKRGLRGEIADLGIDEAELALARARLTTEADVRRSYVDLLLARDRLRLLDELALLWQQSEDSAKARYEAGEGAQSDLLRAQLERTRLEKRRWALEAEERAAVRSLDRLRGRPLDEVVTTDARLREWPEPSIGDRRAELEETFARSPELALARLAERRASRATTLAEKERYPDWALSLGVMIRGMLPPMWQASVSVPLPVFAGDKQDRAVAESRELTQAERAGAASLELILEQRVEERATALAVLERTLALYQRGLLVQAKATAESTLAQYRVGRVTFASVLEAVASYVADEDEFLQTLAEAQRVAIARAELSLEPAGVGGGALTAGRMPGAGSTAGSMGSGSTGAPSSTAAGAAEPSGGGGM